MSRRRLSNEDLLLLRARSSDRATVKKLAEQFDISLSTAYALTRGDRRAAQGGALVTRRGRVGTSADDDEVAGEVMRRLQHRVVVDDQGCWWWPCQSRGAATDIRIEIGGRRRRLLRVVVELYFGTVPAVAVRHLCAGRRTGAVCVSPLHLSDDAAGRAAPGSTVPGAQCVNGHPWNVQTTRMASRPGGRRVRLCRLCAREERRRRLR